MAGRERKERGMPAPPPPSWWPRILIATLLLGTAGWAARTIRLETELLALLPQDLAAVRGLDSFSRQFASDREVILVAEESMSGEEREAAFNKLRVALPSVPGVEKVSPHGAAGLEDGPTLAAWIAWNLQPEQFGEITERLEPEAVREKLAALPGVLAGALDVEDLAMHQFDPLGLLPTPTNGEDAAAAWQEAPGSALTITATRPLIEFQDCVDFCDAVRRQVEAALPGEKRLLLTGRPAFTAEISQQMRRDMQLMITVAVGLAGAAFWAFYRSFRPLLWILPGQFLALGVALTGARLGVGSLNVISMGFGCILLGISMDYSILVYHHFASELRGDQAVWRRLRRGIWFSAATTAAAFLVLTFSSLPGLRQLAWLVASGLLAAAWSATWLLPAVWIRRPPRTLPFIQQASNRLASVMEKWGPAMVMVTLLAGVALSWRVLRQPLLLYAPDLNRFQSDTSNAWRGQLLLTRQDAGSDDAIFLVQAASWDAVHKAAVELTSRFPGVKTPLYSGLIPAPEHQRANRLRWPADRSAILRTAFEEAGLGAEWSRTTLEFCAALNAAASEQAGAFAAIAPLLEKLNHEDSTGCRAVVRIPGAAEHPVPPAGLTIPGALVLPVSWVALREELNAGSVRDLTRLGGGAMAAILILCYLAHRSLRLVLLNVAALACAVLLLAALLAVTGTQLSILSLLCLPLLLGLVVDYSLHVLMTLEHEHYDLRRLYGQIGAPILLTGIASAIGFGAPMLTSQPALRNFGLVMDLGILSAIISCLFLLPVLARWWRPRDPS